MKLVISSIYGRIRGQRDTVQDSAVFCGEVIVRDLPPLTWRGRGGEPSLDPEKRELCGGGILTAAMTFGWGMQTRLRSLWREGAKTKVTPQVSVPCVPLARPAQKPEGEGSHYYSQCRPIPWGCRPSKIEGCSVDLEGKWETAYMRVLSHLIPTVIPLGGQHYAHFTGKETCTERLND